MKTVGKVVLGCGVALALGLGLLLVIGIGFVWMRSRGSAPAGTEPATVASEAAASTPDTPSSATLEKVANDAGALLPASSRYVVIDTREAAYTVYQVIPASRLEEARRKVEGEVSLEIVPWEEFRRGTDRYIKAHVRSLEVDPQDRLMNQLVETIESAGGPVGITWNGGIAVTYSDYQAAKRAYEKTR